MQVFSTSVGVVRRTSRGTSILGGIGPDLDAVLRAHRWDELADVADGEDVDLSAVTIGVPVHPRRIVLVGLNYPMHAEELGFPLPERPAFGVIDSPPVIAAGERIPQTDPPLAQADYEGEIGVVIKRPTRNVNASEAWDHVAGFTAVNDVSDRELQLDAMARNDVPDMIASKSWPGFKPIGPGIIPLRGAPPELRLNLSVNGERRQQGALSELIFDIPTLVEAISAEVSLAEGDIISTGSPSGVGYARDVFLRSGDVIEIALDDLPPLRNVFGA